MPYFLLLHFVQSFQPLKLIGIPHQEMKKMSKDNINTLHLSNLCHLYTPLKKMKFTYLCIIVALVAIVAAAPSHDDKHLKHNYCGQ